MLKFDRPTLVTLTAPTCSGKSYLLSALVEQGCGRIVSTTTRAMRQGEVEGVDYNFINTEYSNELEAAGEFFELIEFRGTRYGVTHNEMKGKMAGQFAPVVVLEPKGLEIYEQKCRENGWDIYKVYVHTVEKLRIERLIQRTVKDVLANVNTFASRTLTATGAFDAIAKEKYESVVPHIIKTHTDRLLSITGEERAWSNTTKWDAIVPGDDLQKTLRMLQDGVKWRNRQRQEPRAIGAVTLPLA